jgi:hypothetical protein
MGPKITAQAAAMYETWVRGLTWRSPDGGERRLKLTRRTGRAMWHHCASNLAPPLRLTPVSHRRRIRLRIPPPVTIWVLAGANMPRLNTPRGGPRGPKAKRTWASGPQGPGVEPWKRYQVYRQVHGAAPEALHGQFQYRLYTLHLVTLATQSVSCPLLLHPQD